MQSLKYNKTPGKRNPTLREYQDHAQVSSALSFPLSSSHATSSQSPSSHHRIRPPRLRLTLARPGSRPSQGVLGKRSSQSLLAADLLTADEAVDGDGNGAVNVLGCAVFR